MNIIVDSTFQPYTFEERLKPFAEYKKEVYDPLNEEFSNLVQMTEAWGNKANQEKSPEAYAQFRRYSDQLNALADEVAAGNTTARTKMSALGMKRDYTKNIKPIEEAYTALKEANDLRDKAGSDAIFEEGRYDSLDRFLHGELANNKYESRKDISARTAALTQAALQNMVRHPEILQSASPQFLEIIQRTGGSMEDLQAAIANDPVAQNEFSKVKRMMMDEIGMDRFDTEGKKQIEAAINEGLFAGLDRPNVTLQNDGNFIGRADGIRLNIAQQAAAREQTSWLQSQGRLPVGKDENGNDIYTNPLGQLTVKTSNGGMKVLNESEQRAAGIKTKGQSSSRTSGIEQDVTKTKNIAIIGARRTSSGQVLYDSDKNVSSNLTTQKYGRKVDFTDLSDSDKAVIATQYPEIWNDYQNYDFYYNFYQSDKDATAIDLSKHAESDIKHWIDGSVWSDGFIHQGTGANEKRIQRGVTVKHKQ